VGYENAALAGHWTNATPQPLWAATNGPAQWMDDGSATAPHPAAVTARFYRVTVSLPE
jgi:hypothetical protein